MSILARSIGLRAADILCAGAAGRVLASFERVCDLVTDEGAVAALVWDGVGNGPLNVVLEQGPGVALPAGTRFAVVGAVLRSDGPADHEGYPLQVDLAAAVMWDPSPDWQALCARRRRIAENSIRLARILAEAGWTAAQCWLPEAVCAAASHGDRAAIQALVGLGPGLTPAGDDWLAGWLLGHRLAADQKGLRDLSGLITKTAAGRTTTLSRAFLACAAAGEADAEWHELLNALAGESTNQRVSESAIAILAHGATSGAAMLIGFITGISI